MKKTVKDVSVQGKRVLVRVDFNVPLEDGQILDDTRIRASLPTLLYLIDQHASVILCTHLDRPNGQVREDLRTDTVARRLSELLGKQVRKINHCAGPEAQAAMQNLAPGEVLLLENLRFHREEEENDASFAAQLAGPADLFVNDAFGACHRAHASTEGVTHHLPAVAGLLMERELEELRRIRQRPDHPFVAVLGGAKISDKIDIIKALIERVDAMLIGGGMGNTFLKSMGLNVGQSLVEDDGLDIAHGFMTQYKEKLVLPVDVVVADSISKTASHRVIPSNVVPREWRIVDIGPRTIDLFTEKLRQARTVLWNGPLGVFEIEAFSAGTFGVARTIANLANAKTVVGGGETIMAAARAGVAEKLTHVSTGGGAFLSFMEGKELPGVDALSDKETENVPEELVSHV